MNTKILFGILSITATLLATAQAQVPFTNSLVAYYPFDGKADDATGNGNNGTLFGAAAFGMDRFGNSNSCLSLPGTAGTGSGVDIPSLSNMLYLPVTYSAWFWLSNYAPNPSGVSVMNLVGREQCGDSFEGSLCVFSKPSAGVTNVIIYYTGPSGCLTQTTPPTNQWCQVVLTIDASGNANFYFNGTNVPAIGSAPAGQPLDFHIGASGSGGCGGSQRYVWNGLIDDVRIYNRALSSNEVRELWAYDSVPQPCMIPRPATATATVTNGFVVATTITDPGCGYTNAPPVLIEGGGGTGAAATALVSNGIVTSITITNTGLDYTNTPFIYIYFPTSITTQPQPSVVHAHDTASFTVTASGTAPLSYQWSLNGSNIAGATSSSLTISDVVQTNLGTYAVVITNYFETNTSTNAVLLMYPFLAVPFGGVDTYWGYTNILTVDAWGSGPLSVQWYQNGVALPGATNATLDLTGAQFTNAGLYSVIVSNVLGSVTNTPEQVVVNPAGVSLGLSPTLTISGVVGYNYVIQGSTNLADTNAWVTVTNLTLTQPVQIWVDTNVNAASPFNATHFYQVLPGP